MSAFYVLSVAASYNLLKHVMRNGETSYGYNNIASGMVPVISQPEKACDGFWLT